MLPTNLTNHQVYYSKLINLTQFNFFFKPSLIMLNFLKFNLTDKGEKNIDE